MEELPIDIENKIEQLPIVDMNESEEFQKVILSETFNDVFDFYKTNYLPDALQNKSEMYQRVSLYLSLTGQGEKFIEDTDQVLYKRPVPSIEEFLSSKFYMGYSNATLYEYWKEQLTQIFKQGSPIRKVIFSGCIGCLTKDTMISTLNGNKTIEQLLNNFDNEWVLSYNTSNNSWEPDKIIDVFYTGNRDVYEITLDNGETIKCTENHQFLSRKNKWVSIEKGTLVPGLSMMPYYYQTDKKGYVEVKDNKTEKWIKRYKIVSIRYLGKQDVYDITTERNHNFALKAGIVAHNSGKSTVARKAFVYVLYRILCLRYPRAVFGIDNDATIANVIISMSLRQVYDTNLLPFVKLMESMPCFQKVLSQRSFENFNLEDPKCPIPFTLEKSSGTVFFPDNIIITTGSNQGHFTGYNVVNSFCFTEAMKVYTNVGVVTFGGLLRRFNRGEKIYTYSIDCNGQKQKTLITDVKQTGYVKELIRIYYDDERYIECTPEHLFPIKNPNINDNMLIYENGIAYKQAQFLTEEDELISEDNAFVYQLIDNRPDSSNYSKPFYIGISSHDNKFTKSFSWKYHRPFTHFTQKSLKQDTNFIKKGIIKKILDLGLNPSVEIIDENLTLKEALDLEKTLIKKYGKICDNSGILSNISDGGEGVILTTSEIIHRKSKKIREIKRKQAEERKNKKNKEWENLINNKFGYLSIMIICLNHIEQTRLKRSIAARSPERVERSRQTMIKYNKSELHRQRTSLQNSLKPKVSSLKSKAKLSASQSATWSKKSEKEKLKNNISKSLGRAWNVLKRIETNSINENIFNVHRSKESRLASTEPMWNTIINKLGGIDNFLKEVEHRYGRRFVYEN